MKAPQEVLLAFAVCLAAVPAACQTAIELKPSRTVRVPNHRADGIIEPIKCDSESNIYVQAVQGSDPPGQTPITRLTEEGEATLFPIPKREDQTLRIVDFAPTSGGGLELLTTDDKGRSYIETYDDHAQFESRSPLPLELEAMQIAASPNGKILIAGSYSNPSNAPEGEQARRPFVGIFNDKGRLEREVALAEDTQRDEGEGSVAEPAAPASKKDDEEALVFSSVQSSTSGNFVLARLRSGGPIYVVAPTGFPLNALRPTLPPGALMHSVKATADTIAVMYVKMKEGSTRHEISDVFISLLDPQTGEERARYHHSSWQLGASFACYSEGVFTFLSTADNGALEIVQAKKAAD
jgi:hypothetical protein